MDCVETAQRVQSFLEQENAWWKWNGHKHLALLASGKLSDFYANCTPLFYAHELKRMIVQVFYRMLWDEMSQSGGIRGKHWGYFTYLQSKNAWVVGSAYGAIWIAESFASILGVKSAFTEKTYQKVSLPSHTTLVETGMKLSRFNLGSAPYVILVEDVTTTGGTTQKTGTAIKEKHPDATFCPVVFTIVNRSGSRRAFFEEPNTEPALCTPVPVKALIEVNARTWESEADLPAEMKDCKGIKPKGNWKALTTEML